MKWNVPWVQERCVLVAARGCAYSRNNLAEVSTKLRKKSILYQPINVSTKAVSPNPSLTSFPVGGETNLGHADARMTERHYAHLVPSHVTQVIRATMPKLGLVEPHSITPLLMCGTSAAACHLENHFRSTWNRTGAQERGRLSYP